MKRRPWAVGLLILLLVCSATAHARDKPDFESPSPDSSTDSATSPNGRYLVTQYDRNPKVYQMNHVINLRDFRTKHYLRLYAHQRDVQIRWSPDSRRMILNDFAGSNVAECHIVRLPSLSFASPDERISRFIGIEKLIGPEILHLYFECAKWLSLKRILVRVWGDGVASLQEGEEVHNFEAQVVYSLNGRMHLLSLKREVDFEHWPSWFH